MQLKNSDTRFGLVAKLLHWIIALLIISLLCVGLYMTSHPKTPQKMDLYGIHKEFGILVLILALSRVLWRLTNTIPRLLLPQWEQFAARLSHLVLYVLMIAMPLSGWLMSSAAGYTPSFFGILLPNLLAPNEGLRDIFAVAHEWLGYSLIAVIILHASAALKHHFIDKNDILKRML